MQPSMQPTGIPTMQPSAQPTSQPSMQPSSELYKWCVSWVDMSCTLAYWRFLQCELCDVRLDNTSFCVSIWQCIYNINSQVNLPCSLRLNLLHNLRCSHRVSRLCNQACSQLVCVYMLSGVVYTPWFLFQARELLHMINIYSWRYIMSFSRFITYVIPLLIYNIRFQESPQCSHLLNPPHR